MCFFAGDTVGVCEVCGKTVCSVVLRYNEAELKLIKSSIKQREHRAAVG